MSMGFAKSKVDPNLYYKVVEDEPVILLLYVDDLFLIGNEKQIMESKKKLAEETGTSLRHRRHRQRLHRD